MTTLMAFTAAVLFATGTYLLLGRQLSRLVIGIGLLGHGANILIVLSGGGRGLPPFVGNDPDEISDPLPQALVLTAIVITFGVIAFLLAMAFRSWLLNEDDDVEDDVEDRRVAEALARAEEEPS